MCPSRTNWERAIRIALRFGLRPGDNFSPTRMASSHSLFQPSEPGCGFLIRDYVRAADGLAAIRCPIRPCHGVNHDLIVCQFLSF